MMKPETLKEVVDEVHRFLRAVDVYQLELLEYPNPYTNPKESAAVKRASMDLTRKLADLRQGR